MFPITKSLLEIRTQVHDLVNSGIYFDPLCKRKVFSGYKDRILFDWDQYFETIIQIYMGFDQEMIVNGILCFLDNQRENGLIPRAIPKIDFEENEHCKPFLSQIILLVERHFKDLSWLNDKYLLRLQKYVDFWLNDMDSNKNGLSEWMSSVHTGMDNQHERAGYWNDRFCEGVDLNCYIYRELCSFAHILRLKKQGRESNVYLDKSKKLKELIINKMWDPVDDFFYDLDMRSGEMIKVKSVSSFMPLWSKVATEEQAKRMINEHLFNSAEFWTNYPISALARTEKGYSQNHLPNDIGCNWRANTWISTNYMIYHGLKYYGYSELASLLEFNTAKLMQKAGSWEYYNSETGEGIKQYPFFGWSMLGYFMNYEEETAYDITSIEICELS